MSKLSFTIRFDTRAVEIIIRNEVNEKIAAGSYLPGGWEMVEAVLEYLREKRDIIINRLSAERAILALASINSGEAKSTTIMGRIISTRLPGSVNISRTEINELLSAYYEATLYNAISYIKDQIAFQKANAEDDIEVDNEILFTGDYCTIENYAQVLQQALQEAVLPDATVVIWPHK